MCQLESFTFASSYADTWQCMRTLHLNQRYYISLHTFYTHVVRIILTIDINGHKYNTLWHAHWMTVTNVDFSFKMRITVHKLTTIFRDHAYSSLLGILWFIPVSGANWMPLLSTMSLLEGLLAAFSPLPQHRTANRNSSDISEQNDCWNKYI